MKKFLEFFKNKSVGYYIAAGVALLSLILGIVFFATYRNPDLATQLGDRADSLAPDTIGIFVVAGFVAEVVVLVLPQYRFIQIIAVAFFGLAFMKDIVLISDFIAGIANNVRYNHGNFPLNFFFFGMLIVIVAASVVVAFLGFYKKEEDATADLPVKGVVGISKVAAGGVLLVAAILVSSLMAVNVTKNAPKQSKEQGSSEQKEVLPQRQLIEDEGIRAICDAYDYSFDPQDVIIKQKEEGYAYTSTGEGYYDPNLSSVPNGKNRSGANLVYYFEGAYAEGWQGDYSQTYGYLYLWDDGLFGGRISDRDIKGYWYNSSLKSGTDKETGEDIADCLNMVSNVSRYESIIAKPKSGFYEYEAYCYCHMSWNGDRSIIMSGYHYYPDVAMFVKTPKELPEFKVGANVDISDWTPNRVLKDYSYSAVFIQTDVSWSATNGSISISYVDDKVERGISSITAKFTQPGEQKIKVSWSGLEAEVTINVSEAEAGE